MRGGRAAPALVEDVGRGSAGRRRHGKGWRGLQTYIAHYQSPRAASQRAKGQFEFESESRVGSKGNSHDARMRMLELYGTEALSWSIERIERKTATGNASDGQLQLDFRAVEPQRKRAKKKEWW